MGTQTSASPFPLDAYVTRRKLQTTLAAVVDDSHAGMSHPYWERRGIYNRKHGISMDDVVTTSKSKSGQSQLAVLDQAEADAALLLQNLVRTDFQFEWVTQVLTLWNSVATVCNDKNEWYRRFGWLTG